jgi:uncharacterized protein YndB with AHSA1/START domain
VTPRGDGARVSVHVGVPPDVAFNAFSEEIDQWWRRGFKYRAAGNARGIIQLEPRVGGRLFESIESEQGTRTVESGRVTLWQPPTRLAFEWRALNFAPGERTEVEVLFEPQGDGTLVTVTHRGWSTLRPDHPVRHGQDVPAFIRTMGLWWGDLMTSLREHVAQGKSASE